MDVIATRAGTDPAKQAEEFLANVTAEAVIQAAMMAEGSDEHLLVRRFFDTEGWDAMSVGNELDRFLRILEHLFIVAKPGTVKDAGCMKHGFVRHACEVLSKPHVCWIRGEQHVLGGPHAVTDELLARCLSRMANWIRLTVSAVSAEFPRWQLLRALDVFNLLQHTKGAPEAATAQRSAEQVGNFERLATAFEVDLCLLMEEYDTCLHIAKKGFLREGTGSSVDAWITAIKMLHRGNVSHLEASPLARILHIAQCWSGLSTSKVEQSFGKSSL